MARIKNEKETLLGLKQMQINQDQTGKNQYYQSYFGIDTASQS